MLIHSVHWLLLINFTSYFFIFFTGYCSQYSLVIVHSIYCLLFRVFTAYLFSLYWLLFTAEYKSMSSPIELQNLLLAILSDLNHLADLTVYSRARYLRSSSERRIVNIPTSKHKSYGQHSCVYHGNFSRNILSFEKRYTGNVAVFKTHLFRQEEGYCLVGIIIYGNYITFVHPLYVSFLFIDTFIDCVS